MKFKYISKTPDAPKITKIFDYEFELDGPSVDVKEPEKIERFLKMGHVGIIQDFIEGEFEIIEDEKLEENIVAENSEISQENIETEDNKQNFESSENSEIKESEESSEENESDKAPTVLNEQQIEEIKQFVASKNHEELKSFIEENKIEANGPQTTALKSAVKKFLIEKKTKELESANVANKTAN